MNSELLDIFDEQYRKIGEASHEAAHQKGYWHQTVHYWLVDRPSGSIVYQRRSAGEKLYPNMLDVSVAGHCRTGETPEQTLAREAMEELGLAADADSARHIGIRRTEYAGANIVNREFQHVFFGYLPGGLYDLQFKDGEVAGALLLNSEAVIGILQQGLAVTADAWDGRVRSAATVTAHDFIRSTDDYDLRIAVLIQRWLAGETSLRI
jgi:isopentenyldiphosphate isomerase